MISPNDNFQGPKSSATAETATSLCETAACARNAVKRRDGEEQHTDTFASGTDDT
jgi:hypothetical protein